MKRVAIVYGSTTGTTAKVAEKMSMVLGEDRAVSLDVAALASEDLESLTTLSWVFPPGDWATCRKTGPPNYTCSGVPT
jgi:flavodoxin